MMKLSTLSKLLFILFLTPCVLILNAHANVINKVALMETMDLVKANDKYITLLGNQINVGDKAPNFKVVDKNFAPIHLSDFKEQTLLISVVPSLDTGVCSLQTQRFNEEAAKLPESVTILTISNDLPFAQKRFCKVENIDQIKVLSDSVWHNFGESYGLTIKNMGLLTRAIFIIDNQGIVQYKELVANISQPPNYDSAITAIKKISAIQSVTTTEDSVKEVASDTTITSNESEAVIENKATAKEVTDK